MATFKLFIADFLKACRRNFGYLDLAGCFPDRACGCVKFDFEHPSVDFSLLVRVEKVSEQVMAVRYHVSSECYAALIGFEIARQVNILNSPWFCADAATGTIICDLSKSGCGLALESVSSGVAPEVSFSASVDDETITRLLNGGRIKSEGGYYRISVDDVIYDFLGITVLNAVLSAKTSAAVKAFRVQFSNLLCQG